MSKQQITKISSPKRGEVYLVNFDPTVGSEIHKTRPALIIQNDIANKHSPVTIVAAITSTTSGNKIYPTEVFVTAGIGGLTNNSLVLLNQIRTIDKIRLVNKLGTLLPADMLRVTNAIQVSLNTIDI